MSVNNPVSLRTGKLHPAVIASIVVNALLAAGLIYMWMGNRANISGGYGTGGKPGSTAGVPGSVEAFGRIQPSGGLISVYGPPGDKINKFDVNIGDPVTPTTKLATLFGEVERDLNIKLLDSQIKEAESLRDAIKLNRDAKLTDIDAEAKQSLAGLDQDTLSIDAKIKLINVEKVRAENTLRRLGEAKTEGVKVSPEEFEQVESTVAKAEAELTGAMAQKSKIDSLKKQSDETVKAKRATVSAETDRALAQVPYDSLKATRTLAERKLKDGELRTATSGKVVRFLSKPGDTIGTMPVIQIANTNKLSVLAEVYETDVGRLREWLKKGSITVDIDARALGNSSDGKPLVLRGSLTSPSKISTVIARNALTPLGPREDADRRVVEVEVDLDSTSTAAAETFLGLQVRVRFEPPK